MDRRAQAYKSTSAQAIRIFFFHDRPNSGPGHNSLLVYVEGQLDYAVRGSATSWISDLRYLDVRHDVQRRIQRTHPAATHQDDVDVGCSSWYLTQGRTHVSMYRRGRSPRSRQMRDFQ